ncbi:MAG: hypothetical protein QOE90_1124 [Thermoplasmata archaeon]|nr:hypothetical protein [Thermoplasmata archaeon]
MRRILNWSAVAIATVMIMPAGFATWAAYGGLEPDNHYDRDGGMMWQNAPTTETNKVYFHVWADEISSDVSPNSATLGSRMEGGVQVDGAGFNNGGFDAEMGVWVDCNHDGYIGLADGALREYQAQVSAAAGHAIDPAICPDLNDAPANAGRIHYDSASGWVTEMIPIAYARDNFGNAHAISTDYRTISDLSAKVWGEGVQPTTFDWGSATGGGCIGGFANGDLGHTGGIMRHEDCGGALGDAVHDDLAAEDPTGTVAGTAEPSTYYAPGGPADRPVPGMGDGTVSTPDRSGSDDSRNSIVSGEQDCNADPAVDLTTYLQDTNNQGSGTGKRGIRAPGGVHTNPQGTVPGTVNETHEELFATDDCKTSDDGGQDFYGTVGERQSYDEIAPPYTAYKTGAGFNFGFRPWNNRQGTAINGCGAGATGKACGTPADAGLPEVYNTVGVGGNLWSVGPGSGTSTGGVVTDRSTTPPTATLDFFPIHWYTFYAYTGASGVSTPGAGTYGTEWCTNGIGGGAPPTNGWDCDPADWYMDLTLDPPQKVAHADLLGTVGDAYNLRDVQCYDSTVAGRGSSENPTGGDVGPRTAGNGVVTQGSCW